MCAKTNAFYSLTQGQLQSTAVQTCRESLGFNDAVCNLNLKFSRRSMIDDDDGNDEGISAKKRGTTI